MSLLENDVAQVVLKPGRDKSLTKRHPWIFSGGIATVKHAPFGGDVVSVVSAEGRVVGKGFWNPNSQIRVRMLTFSDEPITSEFYENRLRAAISRRDHLVHDGTNAVRRVYGESDLLPGLIVDQYDSVVVVQCQSLGMSQIKSVIFEHLQKLLNPTTLIERSDGSVRQEEGIEPVKEVIAGDAVEMVTISENGHLFEVDVWNGQKTGFFLDQRDNRQRMIPYFAGKRVLNCCSYTGGFSVYAAKQGATVTSIDISKTAQAQAQKNFELNQIDPTQHEWLTADVGNALRKLESSYDVIIVDPPALIKKKSAITKGTRAYKDINRLAMRKSNDAAWILSCSCSYHMDWKLFQQVLFSAAQESGRSVQIAGRYGQPEDHPVSLFHPESDYLKTFLLRVFDA